MGRYCALLVVLWLGLAAAHVLQLQGAQLRADDEYPLPEGFIMGAGSSSYQVEGAWDADGKSQSVFDYYYHEKAPKEPNADVACDSYHKYKDDVAMAKALGMTMYRFSLSWSRILPDGENINQPGIDYYNNLINELLANKIEPFITLYHFDHPQLLETQFEGWVSPKMIDMFERFARVAFDAFADRVKYWVTLNEPHMHCFIVYNSASVPPAIFSPGDKEYQCLYHELVAHSRTYHLFKNEYASKAREGTLIGMTGETFFATANDSSQSSIDAAERYNLFELGSQFDPLIFGDFPEVMKKYVLDASLAQNRTESRLPSFSEDEKKALKGSTDFLGINAYFGRTVHDGVPQHAFDPSPQRDMRVVIDSPVNFGAAFSLSTPHALRDTLLWLRDRYGNPPVFITENGYATQHGEGLRDMARAAYHSDYLREVVKAVRDENCKVLGMTAWSLLDGYEWGSKRMMGIVYIDYSTPNRTRMLKDSAAFYIQLNKERKVPLVTIDGNGASALATHVSFWTFCFGILAITFRNLVSL